MSLNGVDIGALKKSIKELLTTDPAHPDTFNPILQDLVNNDVTLEALAKSYTDQQIQLVTESGIPKLVSYQYVLTAESEQQTDFEIPLQTFDQATDTVLVIQNRTPLEPTAYNIVYETGYRIRLVSGVTLGTDLHLVIFKNVPQGPEGSINGGSIAIGSLPVNRLETDIEGNAKAYTDQQIQLVTETGIPKLASYQYVITSTVDNQVDFNIPLDTFDKANDTVVVIVNRTTLTKNDYTIDDFDLNGIYTVRLNEGVAIGAEVFLLVLKNVPVGPEGSINGGVLALGSVPINRLSEEVQTKSSAQDLEIMFWMGAI